MKMLFKNNETSLNQENLNKLVSTTEQSLTGAQKQQARANIEASSEQQITSLTNQLTSLSSQLAGVNATLTAITYKVTFDLNGGAGYFPALTFTKGGTINKPTTIPTKAGRTFKFWTSATNRLKEFDWSRSNFGDVTLVAAWNVYEVKFDLNGGTGDFPPLIIAGGSIMSKPTEVPTKSWVSDDGLMMRYFFLCWRLSTNHINTPYNFDDTPITADITLVADWFWL